MDDDVKQALDEVRAEMKDLARARTPRERQSAERDVRDAREDLEDVLRREGYHLSRRELDRIIEERDERRISDLVDKRLAALRDEEEADGDEVDEDGKPKAKPKPKPKAKPAAATEEEEWT